MIKRQPKGTPVGGQFAQDRKPDGADLSTPVDESDVTTWKFNKDYKDISQVDDIYPAYLRRRAELDEEGLFNHNDRFKGQLGLSDDSDEDTAIYLCQGRFSLEKHDKKVAELIESGAEYVKITDTPVRYSKVVHVGFYMDGTGYQEFNDCKLFLKNGSVFVLPKGNQTNGHYLPGGAVLAVK